LQLQGALENADGLFVVALGSAFACAFGKPGGFSLGSRRFFRILNYHLVAFDRHQHGLREKTKLLQNERSNGSQAGCICGRCLSLEFKKGGDFKPHDPDLAHPPTPFIKSEGVMPKALAITMTFLMPGLRTPRSMSLR